MNLLISTCNALDFTSRLKSALALGDLEMCREILEMRGKAMQAFEKAHRLAGPQEIAQCQDEINQLIQADRELQDIYGKELGSIARDFREKTVSNFQGANQPYQDAPMAACIDRKA